MKTYLSILLSSVLALLLITPSCVKGDADPEAVDYPEYETIQFSLTATIVPSEEDESYGVELKKTFAEGDAVVVTNYSILLEPAVLISDGCAGKGTATFSGELKVRSGASLTSDTRLTAALKNTASADTLYNDGKPFMDVRVVSSFAQGLDRYGYWACEDFAYSNSGVSVNLVQKTAFVAFDIKYGGATLDLSRKALQCEINLTGSAIIAIPSGTKIVSQNLEIEDTFDEDGKYFYKIGGVGVPDDCIRGIFSVGKDKQVFFSKGNLVYDLYNEEWSFASTQYDHFVNVEDVGVNFSTWMTYNSYIDVFGVGTWLEGGGVPYQTTEDESDYPPLLIEDYELAGTCAIGPEWTVLLKSEWTYLLQKRKDAEQKYGSAQILDADVKGIVLLPDEFVLPDGLVFQPFEMFDFDDPKETMNVYTIDDWTRMEQAGAVFLPNTPYRYLELVDNSYPGGWYWTRSAPDDGWYRGIFVTVYGEVYEEKLGYGEGCAVRLVQKL